MHRAVIHMPVASAWLTEHALPLVAPDRVWSLALLLDEAEARGRAEVAGHVEQCEASLASALADLAASARTAMDLRATLAAAERTIATLAADTLRLEAEAADMRALAERVAAERATLAAELRECAGNHSAPLNSSAGCSWCLRESSAFSRIVRGPVDSWLSPPCAVGGSRYHLPHEERDEPGERVAGG